MITAILLFIAGLDDIDTNRHAYLSYSKLSQIVTLVMKPMMEKISKQQDQCSRHADILQDLKSVTNRQDDEIFALKKTVKTIDKIEVAQL